LPIYVLETSLDNTNPLLAKIRLPGRVFQLPSRGALYRNGEIDSVEGEVHVHPLTALTEINLKNPDLLFNGKALEEVCRECVPEIKKPTELFGRDVDALMFYLRLVTYGPQFDINVKHTCAGAKDHSYAVDIEKMVAEVKFLDPTEKFEVVLQTGQVVVLHPVKFVHLIKLFQMNTGKSELSPEDVKANIVFNLTALIESVDGVTNPKHIEEWVRQLTTPMQTQITEQIERMNGWGTASTTTLSCRDCGQNMEVELPLNPISFFTA
jgi:hypothetical protein